jgi:hypothetical protein
LALFRGTPRGLKFSPLFIIIAPAREFLPGFGRRGGKLRFLQTDDFT